MFAPEPQNTPMPFPALPETAVVAVAPEFLM